MEVTLLRIVSFGCVFLALASSKAVPQPSLRSLDEIVEAACPDYKRYPGALPTACLQPQDDKVNPACEVIVSYTLQLCKRPQITIDGPVKGRCPMALGDVERAFQQSTAEVLADLRSNQTCLQFCKKEQIILCDKIYNLATLLQAAATPAPSEPLAQPSDEIAPSKASQAQVQPTGKLAPSKPSQAQASAEEAGNTQPISNPAPLVPHGSKPEPEKPAVSNEKGQQAKIPTEQRENKAPPKLNPVPPVQGESKEKINKPAAGGSLPPKNTENVPPPEPEVADPPNDDSNLPILPPKLPSPVKPSPSQVAPAPNVPPPVPERNVQDGGVVDDGVEPDSPKNNQDPDDEEGDVAPDGVQEEGPAPIDGQDDGSVEDEAGWPLKTEEVKQGKPQDVGADAGLGVGDFSRTVIVDQNGPFQEAPDSHFFVYFLFFTCVSVVGYIAFHNKNKILALALEGRRGRHGRGRRPNSASYRKLDTSLEEAMMSQPSRGPATHVIY